MTSPLVNVCKKEPDVTHPALTFFVGGSLDLQSRFATCTAIPVSRTIRRMMKINTPANIAKGRDGT